VELRQSIEELIYRSCLVLDNKDFSGYLNLCDPAFHYAITAYSPEIRKEMIWLEHDKEGMKTLFGNLPKHNSDHSPVTRHVTVYIVEHDEAKQQAKVISGLQVYKTSLDGGATELFAVGKIYDTIALNSDSPKLLDRNIRLDTRMFGFGYHIPF
jgi:methanesulfonate monooxygenase small subunit